MASLPRFIFPPTQPQNPPNWISTATSPRSTPQKERPKISLRIKSREGKGYTLSVPNLGPGRPTTFGAISTPPDSPTRQRAYTIGMDGPAGRRDGGAQTPPPTPTRISHGKSGSTSSLQESFGSLRRGNSVRSQHKCPVDAKENPVSTETRLFPHRLTDYEIGVDPQGRKKPLGSGAWSTVYRATPRLPRLDGLSTTETSHGAEMTPPVTPVHSHNSSLSTTRVPHIPTAYAIKEPTGRTAQRVLGEEGRILSYLSRFPGAEKYIVPFYGQDSRTDALVLGLMDGTLEDWMQRELDCFPENDRTAKLTIVFPTLASHLLSGFIWITEKHCTHGDLKPANILVSYGPSGTIPLAVYTDFSSATLSLPGCTPPNPVGGATYDYLDPNLMTKAAASVLPTSVTDLWSLAMTLLVVVLGVSPYSRLATNAYMKKEYIKHGSPLAFMKQGENAARNVARLKSLGEGLGWDVEAWLGAVLIANATKRVGVDEWWGMLERGTGAKERG